MEYKNDERYWNIKLLNKWFAISSILFLLSFMWMFYHDNDDDFKRYQREFRKIAVQVSQEKLEKALEEAEADRSIYEEKYGKALNDYNNKSAAIDSINNSLENLQGKFYKANMDFLFQKAEVEGFKYLYEDEIVHSDHGDDDHSSKHEYQYKDSYVSSIELMDSLKLIKESFEFKISSMEETLKSYRSELKVEEDNLNRYLKEVNLLTSKLEKIDRKSMTIFNQIGDFIRDLPIIDFMDPYYKVNQVVVHDVKYDVNFASVPIITTLSLFLFPIIYITDSSNLTS